MISFPKLLHLSRWIFNGLVPFVALLVLIAFQDVSADQNSSTIAAIGNRNPAQQENTQNLFGKSISEIDVRGLKRIEKDAVLAKIGSRAGQILTREQVRSDIQSIFAMGFFVDIEAAAELVEANRVRLIYTIHERPIISKIGFVGNERISSSDLQDVIKIKEWSILDVNKVKEDVALIQKHYEEKGFYLAKVSFSVKTVGADQVELTYRINDYEKVEIKKITFLNNRRFSDEQLKSVLGETREGGFLSFLSSAGNFKESAFKQDLQRLTFWYLEHGYVKFRYENPVVTVSDDKKWLYISIYLDEGEQYRMGPTDFSGDLLFPKEELETEVSLKQADIFAISKRNLDIQRLTEKYQDLGYAFVNVIPKMNIKDDTKTVDVEYQFEKGNLVYFGEINITGNTKTYDKVIRRELKIHEGELYSGTRMRQSRENVERLGFFTPGEVLFNTVTVKGRSDLLNVDIVVKERSTGTITLGAGYGSTQGFFFTSTVSEINLMGRGQTLSFAATFARQNDARSFNLGFKDPYAFDTRWSLGFDLYYVNFPIPDLYLTRKKGFDTIVGYPLTEFSHAYMTYKLERLDITNVVAKGLTQEELDSDVGLLSSIVWSLVRDKRNNRFETTEGNYQSASLETAGLGGDKSFVKWNLNNRFYKRLIGDLVFRTSAELGQITAISGDVIPRSEKFFLGGPNNMKGFNFSTLGPFRIGTDNDRIPLGGTFQGFSLFELEYPIVRDAGLKFVTFFDVGNTWDPLPKGGEPFIIRTDWGLGIRWFSPIGPLRFEWGFPIARRPGEDQNVFNFFIGPPF